MPNFRTAAALALSLSTTPVLAQEASAPTDKTAPAPTTSIKDIHQTVTVEHYTTIVADGHGCFLRVPHTETRTTTTVVVELGDSETLADALDKLKKLDVPKAPEKPAAKKSEPEEKPKRFCNPSLLDGPK